MLMNYIKMHKMYNDMTTIRLEIRVDINNKNLYFFCMIWITDIDMVYVKNIFNDTVSCCLKSLCLLVSASSENFVGEDNSFRFSFWPEPTDCHRLWWRVDFIIRFQNDELVASLFLGWWICSALFQEWWNILNDGKVIFRIIFSSFWIKTDLYQEIMILTFNYPKPDNKNGFSI